MQFRLLDLSCRTTLYGTEKINASDTTSAASAQSKHYVAAGQRSAVLNDLPGADGYQGTPRTTWSSTEIDTAGGARCARRRHRDGPAGQGCGLGRMVNWPAGKRAGQFMRFTIRDLLWLTALLAVALGMGVAWHRDHAKQEQAFDLHYNVLMDNVRRRADEIGRLEAEIARRNNVRGQAEQQQSKSN